MEDTMRKLAWEGLQRIIVIDSEVDSTYWKDKF